MAAWRPPIGGHDARTFDGRCGAVLLLGRRQFVRLAELASFVAVIEPSALIAAAGDRYSNGRIGLSLVKPAGWRFLSLVDFTAIAQRQRLAIDDPDLGQMLRDPGGTPFLVVTKHDADHPDLNPCITCYDEPIEPGVDSALECHRQALQAWTHFLQYASVQVAPARSIPVVRLPRVVEGPVSTRVSWPPQSIR